jgi:hypothetical protein
LSSISFPTNFGGLKLSIVSNAPAVNSLRKSGGINAAVDFSIGQSPLCDLGF